MTGRVRVRVSYEEFIEWYFEVGKSYLEAPIYGAIPDLNARSDAGLLDMFTRIDTDGSGCVDL